MNNPHNLEEGRTYRVMHTLVYQGKSVGMCITDLQVDEGVPYLVFQWCENHDGEFAGCRHPIPRTPLVPVSNDRFQFLIEAPVEIPESPLWTKLLQEVLRK